MWSEGIFGNEVDPGGTVFDNRPHMTTAKAFLINTADQHPFSGQSHDLTRVHQGWGVPDVQNLYDLREDISYVDESWLLGNLEAVEFATLDWIDWFNNRRLFEPIGDIPPVEYEEMYYTGQLALAVGA